MDPAHQAAFEAVQNGAIQAVQQAQQAAAQAQAALAAMPNQQNGNGFAGEKLALFSDSSRDDWILWKERFIDIMALRAAPDQRQRLALRASIGGAAKHAVRHIDIHAAGATIDNVLEAYEGVFLNAATSDMARAELELAIQAVSETELAFHADSGPCTTEPTQVRWISILSNSSANL